MICRDFISTFTRLLLASYLLSFKTAVITQHCCQSISHFEDSSESEQLEKEGESLHRHETLSKLRGLDAENEEIRYLLYDVNEGEGFNLRRDIFVRLAPLVKALNELKNYDIVEKHEDKESSRKEKWILVLPPWSNIPHWRRNSASARERLPWSTFFEVEEMRKYVPVMEFHEFLDEHGLDFGIDSFLSLQHFPFVEGEEWREEVRRGKCEEEAKDLDFGRKWSEFAQTESISLWGNPLKVKAMECFSIRGQAKTLLPTLHEISKKSKSIFLNHAEVVLWDDYGGEEYWRARSGMKFHRKLVQAAEQFLAEKGVEGSFISAHLRRRDFLQRGTKAPSLERVAEELKKLTEGRLQAIYLATDAEKAEISELKNLLGSTILILRHPCNEGSFLKEGECAIIDQILCSKSDYFIGTCESTFTTRIFEERLLLVKEPETTFNSFCGEGCSQPTKWLIPDSIRDELIRSYTL